MNKAAQQLGRLGGKARAKRHNSESLTKMAKKGGEATKAAHGAEYYKELNRKSQEAKRQKKIRTALT